jgi:hypothetical protein
VTAGGGAAPPGYSPDGSPPAPAGVTSNGDGTEGCCCVVAGYARRAGLIASVTAEAEKLIARSPVLGDFLRLRFVDLGPEPGQAGDRYRPVRRIAAELRQEPGDAARNHFALIMIDKSASAIEELLSSCGADPYLAGLRVRSAGIASQEDRAGGAQLADIVASPNGTWSRESDLADALYRQCEDLLSYFAARGEPGLTPAEFAALSQAQQPAAAPGLPAGQAEDVPPDDLLEGSGEPAGDTAVTAGQPALTGAVAVTGATARPPRHVMLGWLPRFPWYRRRPDPAGLGAASLGLAVPPVVPPPRAVGLVSLLIAADPDATEDPGFGRLRAVPLAVDQRLAAQYACGYRVRLVHGDEGGLRGELDAAGQLAGRAARRLVRAGDFAVLFRGLRAMQRRDAALVQPAAASVGLDVVRPAVVVCTADPPLADGGTVIALRDLALEATVVWVLPRDREKLISPALRNIPGVSVVTEHQSVAEDIWDAIAPPRLV